MRACFTCFTFPPLRHGVWQGNDCPTPPVQACAPGSLSAHSVRAARVPQVPAAPNKAIETAQWKKHDRYLCCRAGQTPPDTLACFPGRRRPNEEMRRRRLYPFWYSCGSHTCSREYDIVFDPATSGNYCLGFECEGSRRCTKGDHEWMKNLITVVTSSVASRRREDRS